MMEKRDEGLMCSGRDMPASKDKNIGNVSTSDDQPVKALYLCDGKVENCRRTFCALHPGSDRESCRYTHDISHAANFVRLDTGLSYEYMEIDRGATPQKTTIILQCKVYEQAEHLDNLRQELERQLREGTILMLPSILKLKAIIHDSGSGHIEIYQADQEKLKQLAETSGAG